MDPAIARDLAEARYRRDPIRQIYIRALDSSGQFSHSYTLISREVHFTKLKTVCLQELMAILIEYRYQSAFMQTGRNY